MQTLRLLFWLKWKLTLRGYQRNSAQWLGALLLLLFFLPAAVIIGGLCYMGFSPLNSMKYDLKVHLLYAEFLGIYLLWLFAPLLGFAFNDAYDITRLFIYPVPVRKIFLGVVCGSILDMPTLFLLPTLLAAFFGFTGSILGAVFNIIAVGLFLLHTFSLSQAIILISAGAVRSRRFRDSLVLLFSLGGILYFLGSMSAAQGIKWFDWRAFIETSAWQRINYFPQGLAARALDASQRGEFSDAFMYNLLLAAVTFGTIALASRLVQRVHAEGGSIPAPKNSRQSAKPERIEKEGFSLLRGLPPPMQAIVAKESRYLLRDPYFRLLLSNFAYVMVVGVFMARLLKSAPADNTGSNSFGGASLMLLTELGIVCNIFGTEGGAVTLLFLTPCARKQILLAKNLTHYIAISLLNLVYTLLIAAVSGRWQSLPLSYGWTLISLVVFLALGNFTSIYAPYRLVLNGWRVRRQSASKGFAYTMLYFVIMLIAAILLLPVLAALLLPQYFNSPALYALSVPLALLYAGGLYTGSIFGASRLLTDREERIIAIVAQNEE